MLHDLVAGLSQPPPGLAQTLAGVDVTARTVPHAHWGGWRESKPVTRSGTTHDHFCENKGGQLNVIFTFWEAFLGLHALLSQLWYVLYLFSRLPQVHRAAFWQADHLLRNNRKSPSYRPTYSIFWLTVDPLSTLVPAGPVFLHMEILSCYFGKRKKRQRYKTVYIIVWTAKEIVIP